MSNIRSYKISLLILTIAGVLFSGYLSGTKLFSKACAFGEACPYFLGLPACYFGFAMFFIMMIAAISLARRQGNVEKQFRTITIVAALGILFSGYYTIKEIPFIISEGFSYYTFGLPTCSLGLIFYIITLIVAVIACNKSKA